MRSRTWQWLLGRITGLLTRPNVIAPDGTSIPSTRLGWQLFPPTPKNDTTTT